MEPFIGEIKMFGGNFAPRGYSFCEGQLLPINSYQALFSLLGTIYGGDGRTTFALPDLRGRSPLHFGRGPGLSDIRLGQKGGAEIVTLNQNQIPSHTHAVSAGTAAFALPCSTQPGDSDSPAGRIPAVSANGEEQFTQVGNANAQTAAANTNVTGITVGNTGGNQYHENRAPYLAISFIIALQGTFPSRN